MHGSPQREEALRSSQLVATPLRWWEVTISSAAHGEGPQPQSTGHLRRFQGACLKMQKLNSSPEY